jgi:hypothetical protein
MLSSGAGNSFTNLRTYSADGASDDSFGRHLMIALTTALHRLLYISFSSYIVTQTIKVSF